MKAATGQPPETGTNGFEPCVWMLAGVVDYKLCDHADDCDNCPFDRAVHNGKLPTATVTPPALQAHDAESRPFSVPAFVDLPLSRGKGFQNAVALFYHAAHVWARIETDNKVRVGLDDFGQRTLGRIYSVDLPSDGCAVKQGEICWRAVHKAGETGLVSPVSGRVIKRHIRLRQCPSAINRDPYGDGWAFLIEPEHLEQCLSNLYFGDEAILQTQRDVIKVNSLLDELIREASSTAVGLTLPDGGIRTDYFMKDLPADRARRLINTFFSAPCSLSSEAIDRTSSPS